MRSISDGINNKGVIVMAVDKLPSELPREATQFFGEALFPFVKALANADYSKDLDDLEIPEEFKRAVITHKGKLTPDFEYLNQYL